jgi:hypothetical protein
MSACASRRASPASTASFSASLTTVRAPTRSRAQAKLQRRDRRYTDASHRAHSSSGLGHRPLTAAARVRIPYAPFSVTWLSRFRSTMRVIRDRQPAKARAVPTWVPTSSSAARAPHATG